jgi:mono/diheme cytochrome c family protein
LLACATQLGCQEERHIEIKLPDAAALPDAEPPPAPIPAPTLPPIEGASADKGAKLFASACAGCHGADGKTPGPAAADLRIAPTDLSSPEHLCRTTIGRPLAVPSDVDVLGAIDRGAHRGVAGIAKLDAVSRRSLLLHVKTLSKEFDRPPMTLLPVPPEPEDTPQSRRRGRIIYLAFGCWRCHGTDGKGGNADAVDLLAWNGRKLKSVHPLDDESTYLCGASPERIYQTIALGMGGGKLMPAYAEFAENMGRPDKVPTKEWGKPLRGKVPPEDVDAVRSWYGELLPMGMLRALKPSERRRRAAEYIWDLVHYVRSL